MAAVWDATDLHLMDLRQVRADLLEPLLEEEVDQWRQRLHWDFRPSAELVRRFVAMHALNGYSLVDGIHPIGYSYYVCEERKGFIGDLFIREAYRSLENETRLLGAVLNHLLTNGFTRRVEAQLMMLQNHPSSALASSAYLSTFERDFMRLELAAPFHLPPGPASSWIRIEPWMDYRQEEAAYLIAAAYKGHIDGEINDQYRSVAGARRFLLNIIQYPGCGSFFQPASFLAIDTRTNRSCGLCLASLVAADVGHITQICVSPEVKGQGVGYELLRRSLLSLCEAHCREATLTVTSANEKASRLYREVGFQTMRRFPACVWEGF